MWAPAKITVTAAGGSSKGTTADPLTAAFEGLPVAHDGETAFTFRIVFSEAVAVTAEAMAYARSDGDGRRGDRRGPRRR